MNQQFKQAVSQSIRQTSSPMDRLWNGLCVACCLALNWQLSSVNLGAVKASLLSTYAQQLRGISKPGEPNAFQMVEWSTFAPKVVEGLRLDSKRMLMRTPFHFLNFRQSSLTRLIYSNRRKQQRFARRLSNGLPSAGRP